MEIQLEPVLVRFITKYFNYGRTVQHFYVLVCLAGIREGRLIIQVQFSWTSSELNLNKHRWLRTYTNMRFTSVSFHMKAFAFIHDPQCHILHKTGPWNEIKHHKEKHKSMEISRLVVRFWSPLSSKLRTQVSWVHARLGRSVQTVILNKVKWHNCVVAASHWYFCLCSSTPGFIPSLFMYYYANRIQKGKTFKK